MFARECQNDSETIVLDMKSAERYAFCVNCDANIGGSFSGASHKVSVRVAHSISRDHTEQMWDVLLVLSKQETDGTLTTRVLLCHPDWDDALEIASVHSDSRHCEVRLGREEPVPRDRRSVT